MRLKLFENSITGTHGLSLHCVESYLKILEEAVRLYDRGQCEMIDRQSKTGQVGNIDILRTHLRAVKLGHEKIVVVREMKSYGIHPIMYKGIHIHTSMFELIRSSLLLNSLSIIFPILLSFPELKQILHIKY